ncbi:MAG: hypothetical protein AAFY56_06350 [Pseudomonadota bacterium]
MKALLGAWERFRGPERGAGVGSSGAEGRTHESRTELGPNDRRNLGQGTLEAARIKRAAELF